MNSKTLNIPCGTLCTNILQKYTEYQAKCHPTNVQKVKKKSHQRTWKKRFLYLKPVLFFVFRKSVVAMKHQTLLKITDQFSVSSACNF